MVRTIRLVIWDQNKTNWLSLYTASQVAISEGKLIKIWVVPDTKLSLLECAKVSSLVGGHRHMFLQKSLWCSAQWLGYGLDKPEFDFRQMQSIFLFSTAPNRLWGPLILMFIDCRDKRPGFMSNHSHRSNTEVKNEWSCTFAPSVRAFMARTGATLPLRLWVQ